MFREIRTSERITDQDERRKDELMRILDKRIGTKEFEDDMRFLEEEFGRVASEATFDPDRRIVVG